MSPRKHVKQTAAIEFNAIEHLVDIRDLLCSLYSVVMDEWIFVRIRDISFLDASNTMQMVRLAIVFSIARADFANAIMTVRATTVAPLIIANERSSHFGCVALLLLKCL